MMWYKALVLHAMEYGSPTLSDYQTGEEQRSAQLKVSGCLNNTSTDTFTLDILNNTPKLVLQLRLRQAQEAVKISAKHNDYPLRDDSGTWMGEDKRVGQKPNIIHLLTGRFRERSGKPKYENVGKEFRYYKRRMGLRKLMEKADTEDFKDCSGRACQTLLLANCSQFFPVLLVSSHSNNYAGELVGIHNALEILADVNEARNLSDRSIHIFTDCEAAILVTFRNQILKNTIETI